MSRRNAPNCAVAMSEPLRSRALHTVVPGATAAVPEIRSRSVIAQVALSEG
jgi:hypothetical protein